MRERTLEPTAIDRRLAERLRALRRDHGWSLDELARRSSVSRATLSRLENAEVSATAVVLGRLAAAFETTPSRLLQSVEDVFAPVVRVAEQPLWTDAESGLRRRSVSPPARPLAAELVECELPAGAEIAYERPPRVGLEHHVLVVQGLLQVVVDGEHHDLAPGDCLRYRLTGPSVFATPAASGARYFLVIV